MKAGKGPGISGIIMLFLLPYLLTVIICGRKACPVSRESDMEDYIPAVTATQISGDAPRGAIKAQTVIARTNLSFNCLSGGEKGSASRYDSKCVPGTQKEKNG